ncbi:MAG: hypothetical protein ABH883_08710 [Candidatus Omnitrophota bacterium]
MTNIFPFSYNTAVNQASLNTVAGKDSMVPNPTPYPVPYPGPWYPQGPFTPSGSGLFGADNTLSTILYIGAALTLFTLVFFPRRTV